MNLNEYKKWVVDFYKKRNWYQYDAFIRVGFLTEEVGEVSQAIRTLEIGRDRPDETPRSKEAYTENLMEELGDVLDNIIILADKYDISIDEMIEHHKNKLKSRFEECEV